MTECVWSGCNHKARYLEWSDDAQMELEVCACCWGDHVADQCDEERKEG